jgi:hypothetical protein
MDIFGDAYLIQCYWDTHAMQMLSRCHGFFFATCHRTDKQATSQSEHVDGGNVGIITTTLNAVAGFVASSLQSIQRAVEFERHTWKSGTRFGAGCDETTPTRLLDRTCWEGFANVLVDTQSYIFYRLPFNADDSRTLNRPAAFQRAHRIPVVSSAVYSSAVQEDRR